MRKHVIVVTMLVTLASLLVAPATKAARPDCTEVSEGVGCVEITLVTDGVVEGDVEDITVGVPDKCGPGERLVFGIDTHPFSSLGPVPPEDKATEGVDYVDEHATVVFDETNTTDTGGSVTVSFRTVEDTEDEFRELISITADVESGTCGRVDSAWYRGSATSITDDDDPPAGAPNVKVRGAKVKEGDSGSQPCNFRLKLNHPFDLVVVVDYTIEHVSTDFRDLAPVGGPSEPVRIPAGSKSARIPIGVAGDTEDEPGTKETFVLRIVGAINAVVVRDSATCTIKEERTG